MLRPVKSAHIRQSSLAFPPRMMLASQSEYLISLIILASSNFWTSSSTNFVLSGAISLFFYFIGLKSRRTFNLWVMMEGLTPGKSLSSQAQTSSCALNRWKSFSLFRSIKCFLILNFFLETTSTSSVRPQW